MPSLQRFIKQRFLKASVKNLLAVSEARPSNEVALTTTPHNPSHPAVPRYLSAKGKPYWLIYNPSGASKVRDNNI